MKRIFAFALFTAFALELLSYEIYSDFPGGNIKVVEKTGNKATITQDYRDSDWWFYWNFGVRGAEGKTIIFNFVNAGDKKDRTVTTWSSKHPKSVFSASIEIPYTDNQGVEVTPENLRGLGADIAGALAEYFGQ